MGIEKNEQPRENASKGKHKIQEGCRKVIFQNDRDDDIILPSISKGILARSQVQLHP
ncbi:hypothetical protein [Peribacillus sp. AS_2]|uniref:hypothetical protein n=1 Tax=Peribacillus sp. AS_2 TaxID=2996755 RepID=UPI0022A6B285|nr:hypothetical protein [Peribacillus sp. AS_2]MCZ0871392.1 hypothetical protein [Peribacillus sp. AS_2]